MKTLKEQIEIMTHFMNGGEVEYCHIHDDIWTLKSDIRFDWHYFNYRIKEQKNTVTIEKWLVSIEDENEYKIIETSNIDNYGAYSSYNVVKLLETYEVEL